MEMNDNTKPTTMDMKTCDKCGSRHYGCGGQTTCSRCLNPKERAKKINCSVCGKRCLDRGIDNLCSGCRGLEKWRAKNAPETRRCESCGYLLRTKNPEITKCSRSSCMGKYEYFRAIRGLTVKRKRRIPSPEEPPH